MILGYIHAFSISPQWSRIYKDPPPSLWDIVEVQIAKALLFTTSTIQSRYLVRDLALDMLSE